MNPTLRVPDVLWVEPYGNRPVRAGDVVCFASPELDTNIVHRVISVRPSSPVSAHRSPVTGLRSSVLGLPSPVAIRTQGDNNPLADIRVLAPADLLGRVVAAQRGTRLRSIHGGHAGLMVAWSIKLGKALWGVLAGVASVVYQSLIKGGRFGFLLPGGLRPRVVCFSGRDTAVLKLLMHGHTVGHYNYRAKEWHIRRPFRLFVDERTLPVPKSKD
ncbi:S26 family signal peptidase [candidate division WOR-3 bacterium]|nr:S26 family signal peptidase [candidate division WOR-3 bacterium]